MTVCHSEVVGLLVQVCMKVSPLYVDQHDICGRSTSGIVNNKLRHICDRTPVLALVESYYVFHYFLFKFVSGLKRSFMMEEISRYA